MHEKHALLLLFEEPPFPLLLLLSAAKHTKVNAATLPGKFIMCKSGLHGSHNSLEAAPNFQHLNKSCMQGVADTLPRKPGSRCVLLLLAWP